MKYKFTRKTQMESINNTVISLASPTNISYMWNYGSILGLIMSMQIMTGIFLTFYYNNSTNLAFDSVIHIMRDVTNGWMLRYLHINTASFFFAAIYIHIGRGIYFFSFTKTKLWISGTIMLLSLMMVAFMGYVLPWGQMSLWGATVITNLMSSIPFWGPDIVLWIWGNFSVSNPTLTRFYTIHFITPFIMMSMVIIHLSILHKTGSNNPLGISSNYDKISFYPYYIYKDILGILIIILTITTIVFFQPYIMVDPENFIKANPMVTPAHIQPEWYFLFSYAILRSIPSKLGGVMALVMSILIISYLMLIKSKFSSLEFYPPAKWLFTMFMITVISLMWVGAMKIEYPFYLVGQTLTLFYFAFFFALEMVVNSWDQIN